MIDRAIPLPAPWLFLSVFDLTEKISETDTETLFRHSLYMKNRNAEGGKVLLKEREYTLPRAKPEDGTHV